MAVFERMAFRGVFQSGIIHHFFLSVRPQALMVERVGVLSYLRHTGVCVGDYRLDYLIELPSSGNFHHHPHPDWIDHVGGLDGYALRTGSGK